ncbi:hypothetical protein BKA69DRAFT_1129308 [Paraphysoderma sedebokerense]|nr:hypothetical protein BKA69DRAFT_1129308 [Paraphysoderma sedebokerense]
MNKPIIKTNLNAKLLSFYGAVCLIVLAGFLVTFNQGDYLVDRSLRRDNNFEKQDINSVIDSNSSKPTTILPEQPLIQEPEPFSVDEEDIVILVISSIPTWQRAIASYNSWRRHTNATVLYFVAGLPENYTFPTIDSSLPQKHFITKEKLGTIPQTDIVNLPIPEENNHQVINKTVQALIYAATHFPHKKWFYKCDDDTFVIPSNMKRLLKNFNPKQHYYIGRPILDSNVNSGGAGYILSQSAIQAVKPHLPDCASARGTTDGEDVVISICLGSKVGILATAAPGIAQSHTLGRIQVQLHYGTTSSLRLQKDCRNRLYAEESK